MGCISCEPPALHAPKRCKSFEGGPCPPCLKMKDLKRRMKLAKAKLLEAEHEIEQVAKEYNDLVPQLNHQHDSLSLRLPVEIISSIFKFCTPPIPFDRGPYFEPDVSESWDNIQQRLVLGSVCRNWRRMALSTPQLWDSILVRFDSPLRSDLKRNNEVIEEWLRRSGVVPLSIRVYAYCHFDLVPELPHIIDVLNRQSARWQMLDLRLPSRYHCLFIEEDIGAPNLKSLRLGSAFMMDRVSVGLRGAVQMPKPVEVVLSEMCYNGVHIHWDDVTWVAIDDLYPDECLELLRNAPRLKYCKFNDISNRFTSHHTFSASDIIIHRQLVELAFEFPGSEVMYPFFSQVCFPSLKRLVVKGAYEGQAAEGLAAFLKRSARNLEELFISDTLYDTEELVKVLKEVPSLRKLEVLAEDELPEDPDADFSPDKLFRCLAQTAHTPAATLQEKGTEPSFLPNLQSLIYEVLRPFSWDLLPPILEPVTLFSQKDLHFRPLKTFHLLWHEEVGKETIPMIDKRSTIALLALIEAGLDLRLSDTSRIDRLFKAAKYHNIPYNLDDSDESYSSSEYSE